MKSLNANSMAYEMKDFMMHEMGEMAHFQMEMPSGMFCFTNWAFIYMSECLKTGKRSMMRYPYGMYALTELMWEMEGENTWRLSFMMGGRHFMMEFGKERLENMRSLYKSLLWLGEMMSYHIERPNGEVLGQGSINRFKTLCQECMSHRMAADFGFVFEKMMGA